MSKVPISSRMRWVLAALASPYEMQISLYPPGHDVVTDLVDEFDIALMEMKRDHYLVPEKILEIAALFDPVKAHDPIWSDEALKSSEFWETVRQTSGHVQRMLGYVSEVPERNPSTFVIGKD